MQFDGGAPGETLPLTGPGIFGLMVWVFYLRFTVPVLGVSYGTSLIADEVEDRTITYLFTRPISRGAVLLGKYLAFLVSAAVVVLPSVLVTYFLVAPLLGGSIGQSFPRACHRPWSDCARSGGLRCRLRACRGLVQATAACRARVRVRVGAGGQCHPRVHEALHRVVLPAGARAARHAA